MLEDLARDPRVTVRRGGAPDPEGACVVRSMSLPSTSRKFDAESYIASQRPDAR